MKTDWRLLVGYIVFWLAQAGAQPLYTNDVNVAVDHWTLSWNPPVAGMPFFDNGFFDCTGSQLANGYAEVTIWSDFPSEFIPQTNVVFPATNCVIPLSAMEPGTNTIRVRFALNMPDGSQAFSGSSYITVTAPGVYVRALTKTDLSAKVWTEEAPRVYAAGRASQFWAGSTITLTGWNPPNFYTVETVSTNPPPAVTIPLP